MTAVAQRDRDTAPPAARLRPPSWAIGAAPAVVPALLMLVVGGYGLRHPALGWDENATWLASQRTPGQIVELARHSDGVIAQVEDVATLRDFRRRGLARATVTAAVDAALAMGHEAIFIVADDDDWPKDLYARLGFL